MNTELGKSRPTIFLYTERDSGGYLVESIVVGAINDYSGDKLVVVQDPYNDVKFVYRADFDTIIMEAVGIVDLTEEQFGSRLSVEINNLTYRLASPDQAMTYLRKRTQWIQDKSSAMSVLLHYTATRRSKLSVPRTINRDRVLGIPPDTPVETLAQIIAARNSDTVNRLLDDSADSGREKFTEHFQERDGEMPPRTR